jgi:hypothetical protein
MSPGLVAVTAPMAVGVTGVQQASLKGKLASMDMLV